MSFAARNPFRLALSSLLVCKTFKTLAAGTLFVFISSESTGVDALEISKASEALPPYENLL